MSNFYIVQSQIIFEYKTNFNIRKKVFEFEEKLKDFFKVPFVIHSIPDAIYPELQRFESESTNGHSKLEVAPNRLIFRTSYEDNFKENTEKVQNYLIERLEKFEELIKGEELLYLGYVIEMGFPLKMTNPEINSFIKKNSRALAINDETVDFSLLYSIPIKDKYYLNVRCSKFVNDLQDSKEKPITRIEDLIYGISILLDLNTKLSFRKEVPFNNIFLKEIMNLTFSTIEKNVLENYLRGKIKNVS
ncbi:hypothetical protein IT568_02610 [bacterium]|nr:hypothetical protein [bacterium]